MYEVQAGVPTEIISESLNPASLVPFDTGMDTEGNPYVHAYLPFSVDVHFDRPVGRFSVHITPDSASLFVGTSGGDMHTDPPLPVAISSPPVFFSGIWQEDLDAGYNQVSANDNSNQVSLVMPSSFVRVIAYLLVPAPATWSLSVYGE